MNKKIRLFSAAMIQGRSRAAAASTRGTPEVQFVPVTLGDQSLTKDEVLYNDLSRSLVPHAFYVAASEGVGEKTISCRPSASRRSTRPLARG